MSVCGNHAGDIPLRLSRAGKPLDVLMLPTSKALRNDVRASCFLPSSQKSCALASQAALWVGSARMAASKKPIARWKFPARCSNTPYA
jgi:hypothetical protein